MQSNKVIFLFIFFIILIQSSFAQSNTKLPVLPNSADNPQDFVPARWTIANKLEADLDSDGNTETVLVLQDTNQQLIKDASFMEFNSSIKDEKTGEIKWIADNNPVILAVLSKEKNNYKLIAQNNQIIPLFSDGLYYWKYSVSLENKTLKVELLGKVSLGIRDIFGETTRVYKFQMQNSQFALTEAEEIFWFQAMLARNGRKDSHIKYDFLVKPGFMFSNISMNNQPAKEEIRKITNLITFEKVSADSISKIESMTNIETEETFTAPTFTAKEISQKILQLIKTTNGIEQISSQNIEKEIGGKIIFDDENKYRYGYAGKIANSDWFYQIFSITELNGQKSRSLEFDFKNSKNDDAEILPVCEFDYEDFKNDLVKAGFNVTPNYGEHGRLLSWEFNRNSVQVKLISYKYKTKECVKTLWSIF